MTSHNHVCKTHLGHVDEAQGQGLVAQDGPVLVALPSLQHDLKLVGVPLQEVRVLPAHRNTRVNSHARAHEHLPR